MDNYGVSVDYLSVHHIYHSAWKYVTKSDVMNILVYKTLRNPKRQMPAKQDARGKQNHQRNIPWLKKTHLKMKTRLGRGHPAVERTNENVE